MKRNIFYIVLCLCSAMAMAQETYESAQLATEDLNGTARYIGMGGAMEALGADISTMGTNPAGIGMFRRSWIGISGGATMQSGQGNNNTMVGVGTSNSKSNADMNQAGFIYSNQFSYNSHFNLGFNYHKSRNFNQIISAANSLNSASSNKMSWMRGYNAGSNPDLAYPKNINSTGITLQDYYNLRSVNDPIYDQFGSKDINFWNANAYNAQRENTGYISEFDFNFSANFNDRVYLGLTFGLKDVNYKSEYNYSEVLVSGPDNTPSYSPIGTYSFNENRKISGTGFDLKFGAIIRPSEYSPFRFGLYMHTPTWYDLTCESTLRTSTRVTVDGNTFDGPMRKYNPSDVSNSFRYDYRIVTPWKFGASIGHTFGKIVAIGATYEYADYSAIKNRVRTGNVSYYNRWGDYINSYNTYSDDTQMNNHTDKTLKGVSLVKIGIEVKPSQLLALRAGYNYQSAIYNEDGKKSTHMNADFYSGGSRGYDNSTQDYVNWKDTHRITFGMGFTFDKNWALDLSYQYALQNGDYHPFSSITTTATEADKSSCYDNPTTVKNRRHMINATLGYRF